MKRNNSIVSKSQDEPLYRNDDIAEYLSTLDQNYSNAKTYAEALSSFMSSKARVINEMVSQLIEVAQTTGNDGKYFHPLFVLDKILYELSDGDKAVYDQLKKQYIFTADSTVAGKPVLYQPDFDQNITANDSDEKIFTSDQHIPDDAKEILIKNFGKCLTCGDSYVDWFDAYRNSVYMYAGLINKTDPRIITSNPDKIVSFTDIEDAYGKFATQTEAIQDTLDAVAEDAISSSADIVQNAKDIYGEVANSAIVTNIKSLVSKFSGSPMDIVKSMASLMTSSLDQMNETVTDETGSFVCNIRMEDYSDMSAASAYAAANVTVFKAIADGIVNATKAIAAGLRVVFNLAGKLVGKIVDYVEPLVTNPLITINKNPDRDTFNVPVFSLMSDFDSMLNIKHYSSIGLENNEQIGTLINSIFNKADGYNYFANQILEQFSDQTALCIDLKFGQLYAYNHRTDVIPATYFNYKSRDARYVLKIDEFSPEGDVTFNSDVPWMKQIVKYDKEDNPDYGNWINGTIEMRGVINHLDVYSTGVTNPIPVFDWIKREHQHFKIYDEQHGRIASIGYMKLLDPSGGVVHEWEPVVGSPGYPAWEDYTDLPLINDVVQRPYVNLRADRLPYIDFENIIEHEIKLDNAFVWGLAFLVGIWDDGGAGEKSFSDPVRYRTMKHHWKFKDVDVPEKYTDEYGIEWTIHNVKISDHEVSFNMSYYGSEDWTVENSLDFLIEYPIKPYPYKPNVPTFKSILQRLFFICDVYDIPYLGDESVKALLGKIAMYLFDLEEEPIYDDYGQFHNDLVDHGLCWYFRFLCFDGYLIPTMPYKDDNYGSLKDAQTLPVCWVDSAAVRDDFGNPFPKLDSSYTARQALDLIFPEEQSDVVFKAGDFNETAKLKDFTAGLLASLNKWITYSILRASVFSGKPFIRSDKAPNILDAKWFIKQDDAYMQVFPSLAIIDNGHIWVMTVKEDLHKHNIDGYLITYQQRLFQGNHKPRNNAAIDVMSNACKWNPTITFKDEGNVTTRDILNNVLITEGTMVYVYNAPSLKTDFIYNIVCTSLLLGPCISMITNDFSYMYEYASRFGDYPTFIPYKQVAELDQPKYHLQTNGELLAKAQKLKNLNATIALIVASTVAILAIKFVVKRKFKAIAENLANKSEAQKYEYQDFISEYTSGKPHTYLDAGTYTKITDFNWHMIQSFNTRMPGVIPAQTFEALMDLHSQTTSGGDIDSKWYVKISEDLSDETVISISESEYQWAKSYYIKLTRKNNLKSTILSKLGANAYSYNVYDNDDGSNDVESTDVLQAQENEDVTEVISLLKG